MNFACNIVIGVIFCGFDNQSPIIKPDMQCTIENKQSFNIFLSVVFINSLKTKIYEMDLVKAAIKVQPKFNTFKCCIIYILQVGYICPFESFVIVKS